MMKLFDKRSAAFILKRVACLRNFDGERGASATLIIVKITETPSEWFSSCVSRSALVCGVSGDTESRKMGH